MSVGCAKVLESDCVIAVSGISGPDGGTTDKPVGTTWICTKYRDKVLTNKYQFGSSREVNIERASNLGILQMIGMLKSN